LDWAGSLLHFAEQSQGRFPDIFQMLLPPVFLSRVLTCVDLVQLGAMVLSMNDDEYGE
jgi:hypothetical protein